MTFTKITDKMAYSVEFVFIRKYYDSKNRCEVILMSETIRKTTYMPQRNLKPERTVGDVPHTPSILDLLTPLTENRLQHFQRIRRFLNTCRRRFGSSAQQLYQSLQILWIPPPTHTHTHTRTHTTILLWLQVRVHPEITFIRLT